MIRKLVLTGSAVCMLAQADFSYDQTAKITGGAMQSMMRVAGAFSKAAREPIRSTIMVKGDRMATITAGERIDVIDLNSQTFTEIDLKKKAYSVVTFAEMAAAIEKAAAEARKKEGGNDTEVRMKADVKPTGATRNIAGMDTKETIVTLTTEFENKKDEAKGAMSFVMDMWLAPKIAGYDEVRDFHMRFAQKVNWNPFGGMAGAMMAGNSKGMAELVKEMSKIDGLPVLQIIKMGGMAGQPGAEGTAPPQRQQQAEPQAPPPSAGDAAAGAALGRLGGRLGGLGGFGRKKKQEQEQAPPPPPPQQEQQQAAAPAGAAGSLMEMTVELSGFSNAAVEGSKFDVPAGFKKVDSQRYKN